METPSPKERICTCGCSEHMHIDGCEQCFNGDCGCKEFEEAELSEMEKARDIHANYPNLGHGAGSRCPIEFCSKCFEVDNR